MCGIVGYIGRQEAAPVVLEGLTRLEHRGYDSAGVAVLGNRGIRVVKQAGRVRDLGDALPKRFAGATGIGHTRWATHGPATDANAHPHTDEAGRVAVVHNGIIDNSAALRAELADAGTILARDTATEVLAHLVARSDADPHPRILTRRKARSSRASMSRPPRWAVPKRSSSRPRSTRSAAAGCSSISLSPTPTTSGLPLRATTMRSGKSACSTARP